MYLRGEKVQLGMKFMTKAYGVLIIKVSKNVRRGKMKKKLLIICSVILMSIFVIGTVGMSIFTGQSMIEGAFKMNTHEQTKENGEKFLEEQGFSTEEFKEHHQYIEEVSIVSSKGAHQISADYMTYDGNKNHDTVILVHGHGGDRTTMYPLAQMFLEEGYNVLTYDQRNSGDNTSEYTTFGYLESEDLQDCVAFVRTQVSRDKKVGILGQSMGGATAGFYAGKAHANKNVDFIILDGPFDDMYEMIESVMYEMNTGIPVPYLMFCGSVGTKLKLGFFYQDMNVSKSIAHTEVPVLVITSKADKTCPSYMGEAIYEAIPHMNKALWLQEDIEHIMGYYVEPVQYTKEVMTFIETYTKK